jgi:hypothetical protein
MLFYKVLQRGCLSQAKFSTDVVWCDAGGFDSLDYGGFDKLNHRDRLNHRDKLNQRDRLNQRVMLCHCGVFAGKITGN